MKFEMEQKMEALNSLKIIGISILLAAGLAACEKPGPAETAGRNIDQTAADAGNKVRETVDKVGDKLNLQGDKTAVAIDDAEITTKVKAAVFAEPGLKTLQIGVDTVKSVVTLSGSVGTQSNSDKANALATAVAGVVRVENRLVLKPSK
jgi:osmotically-inducible protein OsmY